MSTTAETDRPGTDIWTIRRVLTWATDDLKKRGSLSPRLDAELLLCLVLKTTRVQLIIDAERPLQKEELDRYKSLHIRRRAGEPIAYLTGTREFFGRPFRVDARVLIPRPDTEILVEVALRRTRHLSLSARVLDLCTGSGCVAISLGRERPTTRVIATDISQAALDVARENALRLGAINVAFLQGDLFGALSLQISQRAHHKHRARFDLITANPPYIREDELPELQADVRDFEPRQALLGGKDGLDIVRLILEQAPLYLEDQGVIAMEIGADQAQQTAALFEQAGFSGIEITRDLAQHDRVVSGIRA